MDVRSCLQILLFHFILFLVYLVCSKGPNTPHENVFVFKRIVRNFQVRDCHCAIEELLRASALFMWTADMNLPKLLNCHAQAHLLQCKAVCYQKM